MANTKVVGPDKLPMGLNHDPAAVREFHRMVRLVWHQRKVPQRWRNTTIEILRKTKDRTECGNYCGISLVAYSGKVTTRLGGYCEAKRLQPDEQCGFRPPRSTTEKSVRNAVLMCFIDLQKTYDSVDCTLLWQVLARFGLPPHSTVVAVMCQFHDGTRGCVRNDDDVCSE